MGHKRKARKAGPRQTFHQKYGYPKALLGKKYHQDAVLFYDKYCKPEWDSCPSLEPPSFLVTVKTLISFAESRSRIKKLGPTATYEEKRCRQQDLCTWRTGLNKAALSEPVLGLIEWAYQVEVQENGEIYRVMTSEKRVANGRDGEVIAGTIKAKQKKIKNLFRSIKALHHTPGVINDFSFKSDSDDTLIDDGLRSVTEAQHRAAISAPIKRLKRWRDS